MSRGPKAKAPHAKSKAKSKTYQVGQIRCHLSWPEPSTFRLPNEVRRRLISTNPDLNFDAVFFDYVEGQVSAYIDGYEINKTGLFSARDVDAHLVKIINVVDRLSQLLHSIPTDNTGRNADERSLRSVESGDALQYLADLIEFETDEQSKPAATPRSCALWHVELMWVFKNRVPHKQKWNDAYLLPGAPAGAPNAGNIVRREARIVFPRLSIDVEPGEQTIATVNVMENLFFMRQMALAIKEDRISDDMRCDYAQKSLPAALHGLATSVIFAQDEITRSNEATARIHAEAEAEGRRSYVRGKRLELQPDPAKEKGFKKARELRKGDSPLQLLACNLARLFVFAGGTLARHKDARERALTPFMAFVAEVAAALPVAYSGEMEILLHRAVTCAKEVEVEYTASAD